MEEICISLVYSKGSLIRLIIDNLVSSKYESFYNELNASKKYNLFLREFTVHLNIKLRNKIPF